MQKDKQGDAVARFIIVFIVAIGVLNTVLMSVMERTREYGVLKAVGTKPIQVFWLVIYEVVIISIGSIVIGAMLGVFFNYLLSVYGVSYAEGFTLAGVEFGKMYAEVNVACLLIPATTVFVSAVIVSLFPAIKAARIMPARAMRIH
ncbi:FtsX-like permease family protein [Candidatus Poribacteria bacterium]|nr:FtsX-like permease family protein [Candidatus Poribacteria bacterium]